METTIYGENGDVLGSVRLGDQAAVRELVRGQYGTDNATVYYQHDGRWVTWTGGPGGSEGYIEDADVPESVRSRAS